MHFRVLQAAAQSARAWSVFPPALPHLPHVSTATLPLLARLAEPLRSWVQQRAGEAGLKYQAVVERLDAERRARDAASSSQGKL